MWNTPCTKYTQIGTYHSGINRAVWQGRIRWQEPMQDQLYSIYFAPFYSESALEWLQLLYNQELEEEYYWDYYDLNGSLF